MSAFILTDKNYDYILTTLNRGRYGHRLSAYIGNEHVDFSDVKSLEKLGTILKEQNYRSVNARYNEQTECEPYSFSSINTDIPKVSNAMASLKILDCYEYQSCETDDYTSTMAHEIVATFRKLLISKLNGYDDAPWGL